MLKTLQAHVEEVKVNGKEAVVNVNTEAYFEAAKNADERFTKALLKDVQKFEDEYLASTADLVKEVAVKAFKDNADVEKLDVVIPFGVNKSDKIEYSVDRSKKFTKPPKEKGGESEEFHRANIGRPVITKTGCKLSKAKIKTLSLELDEAIN